MAEAATSSLGLVGDSTGKQIVVKAQYFVQRPGHLPQPATVLDIRANRKGARDVYISFPGQDKRLDSWIPENELGELVTEDAGNTEDHGKRNGAASGTPERSFSEVSDNPKLHAPSPSIESSPEREHASLTRLRNYEEVRFGEYLINTWYYSPYPINQTEAPPVHHNPSEAPSSRKRKISETNGTSEHQASSSRLPAQSHSTAGPSKSQEGLAHPDRSQMSRLASDMFAAGAEKGEGGKRRLWVCDLCFKYMKTRAAWDRHCISCTMMEPPGRRVYRRGSYTIWEVDGAFAPLYCQNLSLFGKLFIDHKSIFFHVENFLFYIICDAATSRREQAMAFFSKEKVSYDDYNLACIVAFPPFQNRGFGKLLIEFSYYLTKHPATRSKSLSAGTPERPLSDLGLKGYTAYWVSVILRFLKLLVRDAEPVAGQSPVKQRGSLAAWASPVKPGAPNSRNLRARKEAVDKGEKIVAGDVDVLRMPIPGHSGQFNIALALSDIAKTCHLRIDDVAFTLSELGFLHHRRAATIPMRKRTRNTHDIHVEEGQGGEVEEERVEDEDLGEWKGMEVVISKGMVEEAWRRWRVREQGVLEESCVLL
ncbi:hypothetical protein B9479_007922 [Cryptococcus floricola]|uniref:histone acetyltransferase n=1 Tax=Cryptococcus floricola TaxID=2591691 RepID=A0A5D3AKK5_9TREE|nr:hypothetical protein B9479_007922 [Cryptococcus floricola]